MFFDLTCNIILCLVFLFFSVRIVDSDGSFGSGEFAAVCSVADKQNGGLFRKYGKLIDQFIFFRIDADDNFILVLDCLL